MTTVAQQWQEFADVVLPVGCSRAQRTETRRAFYAGAWAMFVITSEEVTQLDDDAAVLMLEYLRLECLEFSARVRRGEA